MKKNKIVKTTETLSVEGDVVGTGNIYVENMFGGFPTKIQNDPSFKQLTVGAQNLSPPLSVGP